MVLTRRGVMAAGTLAALTLSGKPADALGRIIRLGTPKPAPQAAFFTADGNSRTLADYKNKPLLVNLWATWCVPCVKELPSLAKLAGALQAEGFVVLPVSSDLGGAARVESFFKQHGISNLPVLIDKDGALMHAFGARGLPTTYVIDAAGDIVAYEEGGMDWDAPQVASRLRSLVGGATG